MKFCPQDLSFSVSHPKDNGSGKIGSLTVSHIYLIQNCAPSCLEYVCIWISSCLILLQQHPLDVQYFDKTFTAERAKLTPVQREILQSMDQTQFQGFSYTNPNATDWSGIHYFYLLGLISVLDHCQAVLLLNWPLPHKTQGRNLPTHTLSFSWCCAPSVSKRVYIFSRAVWNICILLCTSWYELL
jgi:hypothetical protein